MLTNMKVNEFLSTLGSNEPAPGGGSASALAAAMGAGLVKMVAELTVGRKKYEEHNDLMQDIINKSDNILNELTKKIDEDTESYNGVTAVFSMPKETEDEKKLRAEAMQNALKAATLVPLQVMELCVKALDIVNSAKGKSNTNAASDLEVSELLLTAGRKGAWHNVMINLDGIKDKAFVDEITQKSKKLLES